ncbi:MAG: tetratricopeptide repeat protein [Sphingomonadaceae bacterium]|nr:tetratricopeptide repeat protein [Sphingomonadaceae bacterium]
MSESQRIAPSRLALAGAAAIALFAIGYSVARGDDPEVTASGAPEGAPQAMAAAEGGDFAELIPQLEARLRDDPEDEEGWALLGLSYYQTGRFDEAAEAYRRAAALNPTLARHRSARGEALVLASSEEGFPRDAAAAFREAIRLDSADPRARYFLAVEKDMGGDREGALEDWIALLEDTPPGAPWEADLRRLIAEVSHQTGIDVSDRVPPPGRTDADDAPAAATRGIPGPTREQMAAARNLPPGQQEMMIEDMVEGLDQRLRRNRNDADGWIMLMRSRMQLGQTAQASQAWRRARQAFAGNSGQLQRINASARTLGVPGA